MVVPLDVAVFCCLDGLAIRRPPCDVSSTVNKHGQSVPAQRRRKDHLSIGFWLSRIIPLGVPSWFMSTKIIQYHAMSSRAATTLAALPFISSSKGGELPNVARSTIHKS